MENPAEFFTTLKRLTPTLTQSQVTGTNVILHAMEGSPLSYTSCALGTAWHECNATQQPVEEAYYLAGQVKDLATWRKRNLRYWPWHGRGYVQLTWERNYKIADAALAKAGLIKAGDLLKTPALAMRPDIAAFIMRTGMDEGWFTGIKFSTFLPKKGVATREQYMKSRMIINGMDKADLIEDYCQVFERALRVGGWPQQ